MATNDQYRVTKDTSARKQPNMVPAHEVTAMVASHKAYVNSIESYHKEQTDSLEATHADEIAGLEAKFANAESAILQKQQDTVDAAVSEAREDCRAQIARLTQINVNIATEKRQLQSSFDETLAKNKNEVSTAQREVARIQKQVTTIKQAHANEIAEFQRQLKIGPNSWIGVTIFSKGRKTRDYVRRPHSTFKALRE